MIWRRPHLHPGRPVSPIEAHVLEKTTPLLGNISSMELATNRPVGSSLGGEGEGMVIYRVLSVRFRGL